MFRIDDGIHTTRPGFIEIHTIDAGEDFDGNRLPAEADEFTRILQMPQVEIFGRTWLGMERDGIATDDQIFNVVGVEGR